MDRLQISPKGTNIPGHYRECEERSCSRLIPCPHIRCQEHRTDMAIKDWTVQHSKFTKDDEFKILLSMEDIDKIDEEIKNIDSNSKKILMSQT